MAAIRVSWQGQTQVHEATDDRAGVPLCRGILQRSSVCDDEFMVQTVADMKPCSSRRQRSEYHSYKFGWTVAGRRSPDDPGRRSFRDFLAGQDLRAAAHSDLWVGILTRWSHASPAAGCSSRTRLAESLVGPSHFLGQGYRAKGDLWPAGREARVHTGCQRIATRAVVDFCVARQPRISGRSCCCPRVGSLVNTVSRQRVT